MTDGERTIYRGCTPIVDTTFDGADDTLPTEVIIDAIATAAGVDPLELPPLYDFVDPDAVNKLFQKHDVTRNALLSFTMDSWNVFVRADGKIRVCDATRPTDPEPIFEGTIA